MGMSAKSKKAAVAMSGGVDSSVAAALLKREGWEVLGVTLRLLPDAPGVEDARRVAEHLGIPHRVLDCVSFFKEKVVDYFCREYLQGRTPNPCAVCNPAIKFGVLLEEVLKWGMDYLATGHYARCVWDEEKQCYLLLAGADWRKDQSYFLYRLSQAQLARVLFPLGGLMKEEVRALARQWGLPAAEKKESQEICFVNGGGYAELVREWSRSEKGGAAGIGEESAGEGVKKPGDRAGGRLGAGRAAGPNGGSGAGPCAWQTVRPGPILDREGKCLGEHRGLIYYTVGQRRGLGIHAPHPLYVLKLDKDRNALIVGKEEELYSARLRAGEVHFISPALVPSEEEWVQARIRSTARPAKARLFLLGQPLGAREAEVVFEQPQRAVTPGQAVVFYKGETVLGGGVILS